MNMGQRHKHADVIIAWAEGKAVQVRDEGTNRWYDVRGKFPLFNEDREHRIKPPAKKYRVALFRRCNYEPLAVAANSSEVAKHYESKLSFIRWLTDWVEYEE
jgi:hypothetical protein